MMTNIVDGKTSSLFINYINKRIFKKNKNIFIIIVGPTGSGKSYAALRLAELLDDSFTVDRCCFRAKEFMNCVNVLINSRQAIRGKVLLWDELGVEHSARTFMTISNRIMNYFFQTSRNLNLIVIMTVPLLSFIDSNTRKLSHCIIETRRINKTTKKVTLKVKMLQTNVITGKEYPKYLRVSLNKGNFVLKEVKLNMPTEKIRIPYESKKINFNKELNIRILGKLDKVEKDDVKESIPLKPLTPLQQKIYNYLEEGKLKKIEIAEILGIDPGAISHSLNFMRNKGYNLNFAKKNAVL